MFEIISPDLDGLLLGCQTNTELEGVWQSKVCSQTTCRAVSNSISVSMDMRFRAFLLGTRELRESTPTTPQTIGADVNTSKWVHGAMIIYGFAHCLTKNHAFRMNTVPPVAARPTR